MLPQIITPLLGRYNVYNVLAAVAVGIALDLSLHVRHANHAHSSFHPCPEVDVTQQLRQGRCRCLCTSHWLCKLTADYTAFHTLTSPDPEPGPK